MTHETTDSLVKPDMEAVLERTHVATDLHEFLLPVFEAISNAMDGIETRFGDQAASRGEVAFTTASTHSSARF